MHPEEQFLALLNRYRSGVLSPEDEAAFVALLQTGKYRDLLAMDVQQTLQRKYEDHELTALSQDRSQEIIQSIFDIQAIQRHTMMDRPHRIHFLQRTWFKYAAAVLVTLGVAAYFWNNTAKEKESRAAIVKNRMETDIPPGGEKAVLTLADGTKIVLDNAANGKLTQQGNAQVVKLSNGQIAYDVKAASDKAAVWNTMTTPAGGQYQVTLPDGTEVWLNAESSITYPTSFVGKTRQVRISGEVYFEVAKDKIKPFVVDVDGKSNVQVLGTSFNINSYGDEGTIKTTLLEGSVKVTQEAEAVILKPGQQARVWATDIAASSERQHKISGTDDKPSIIVYSNTDIEQTLAWKNGLFNFNDADLHAVMRQLERWYDIKVTYEGSVPGTKFSGKIYRNVSLFDVLDALKRMGVNYRIHGKMLVVF